MSTNPDVDTYLAERPPPIRAILTALRAAVHRADPAVEEAIKWRTPFFVLDGRPMLVMAGHARHVSFGLWQMTGEPPASPLDAWGTLRDVAELPEETALAAAITTALRIARDRPSTAARRPAPVQPQPIPADLAAALATLPAAASAFEAFPPGARNDYVAWLDEAKRPDTRARRLATALEWIAEGKRRHWRYERA